MAFSKVKVITELRGAFAQTIIEVEYFNPSAQNPFECTYMFPLEDTSVLAKLDACIDDRIIETKIEDKQ